MRKLRSLMFNGAFATSIDGDHGVGDADRLEVDRPAGVGLLLIGGAFAGEGGGSHEARAE